MHEEHVAVSEQAPISLVAASPMESLAEFLKGFADGATEADIARKYPDASQEDIARALNDLIKRQRVDIINCSGRLVYRASQQFASSDERIIYNLIRESGGSGVLLRDLRARSNMAQALVSKMLKALEARLLIKAVKSVKSNRRVYILYGQTPSDELTGGVWFNDCEPDEVFISEMSKVVHAFLIRSARRSGVHVLQRAGTLPTADDIVGFVQASGVSSVPLCADDIRALMDTMVADGLVQEIRCGDKTHYRALQKI